MKREADWPRYMVARRLAGGRTGYYWVPHRRDLAAGFTFGNEKLGDDYAAACQKAAMLNEHLDAWRDGKAMPEGVTHRRTGSVDWWHEQYFRSEAFKALSERTRADYRAALAAIADLPTKVVDARTGEPARTGALPVCSLSQAAVDIIYERLRRDGAVTRQADYAIDVARRAWKVVRRKHPGLFLIPVTDPHGKTARFAVNPFEGVERVHYERDTAIPATRAEALVFAMAAFKAGHPALGVAALICFEWHQRPEDVRRGRITWTDYRPATRPNKVQVFTTRRASGYGRSSRSSTVESAGCSIPSSRICSRNYRDSGCRW